MNKCETCRANGICDHNRFGFETCGNYIPTNEWISVEDRLPENVQIVLIYSLFEGVEVYKYDDGSNEYSKSNHSRWWNYEGCWTTIEKNEITHWMPLPEPPKGETR